MAYLHKYIKYKTKYLNLKSVPQIGGGMEVGDFVKVSKVNQILLSTLKSDLLRNIYIVVSISKDDVTMKNVDNPEFPLRLNKKYIEELVLNDEQKE